MKEAVSLETERTDDIPLLLTHMQHMQLAILLDKYVPTHGLRKGLSMGELTLVWLTHVLISGRSSDEPGPGPGRSETHHPARVRTGGPDPFGCDG